MLAAQEHEELRLPPPPSSRLGTASHGSASRIAAASITTDDRLQLVRTGARTTPSLPNSSVRPRTAA